MRRWPPNWLTRFPSSPGRRTLPISAH
jgi:hypothetical protein